MNARMTLLSLSCFVACAGSMGWSEAEEPNKEFSSGVRKAVERALPLLERGSAGSAENRTCFTCHSQAMPVIAFTEASRRGFRPDPANLARQVEHTYAHLRRGRKNYSEGKGQGGGVDTAGYALWTLEDGNREPDEVTDAMVHYLLQQQEDRGCWRSSSKRPPSEASTFTATYLALRSISAFGDNADPEQIETALQRATKWLRDATPRDTEDRVFQLLSFDYVDLAEKLRESAVQQLLKSQREDGGWGQKEQMDSDAYATGSVLYALHRSGTPVTIEPWMRGIRFLLNEQLEDGSWHVKSRSKPFQKYFETGFPHREDQFISTSATCWATIALLHSMPEKEAPSVETLHGGR